MWPIKPNNTSKNMAKMPLISMQIPGNQFLSRRLLGHVLQENQPAIANISQTSNEKEIKQAIGYKDTGRKSN
jgi:hypothetical protein